MTLDPETFRPLKRSEYQKLAELGAFEGERVELLRGMVVRMAPRGTAHDGTLEKLTHLLVSRLYPRAHVRVQCSFLAADGSQPEPDFAVVDAVSHTREHPTTAHLVVEVSSSSLATDREVKAAIYAESNVPEYWVVNLVDRVIEVSTEPREGVYARTAILRRGAKVTLVAFPGLTLSVDDFLTEE